MPASPFKAVPLRGRCPSEKLCIHVSVNWGPFLRYPLSQSPTLLGSTSWPWPLTFWKLPLNASSSILDSLQDLVRLRGPRQLRSSRNSPGTCRLLTPARQNNNRDMSVCIYIYRYAHGNGHGNGHLSRWISVSDTHVYIYIHHTCVYIYTYTCMLAYIQRYIHINVCGYIYIYVYIYIYTCI